MRLLKRIVGLVTLVAFTCTSWAAYAGEPIEVPLNFGIGPAAFMLTGPIQQDQALHYGLHLEIAAIIDNALIKKNMKRVPKRYRAMAKKVPEVRISHPLIPDSLIISPRVENTMIYGVNWRPIGLGLSLMRNPVRVSAGLGLMVTYAYINTEKKSPTTVLPDKLPEGTTHFFRPGLDARFIVEIPVTESFLVSLGWSSAAYIPQKLGTFKEIKPMDESIFHIGQGFLVFHYRFPVRRQL